MNCLDCQYMLQCLLDGDAIPDRAEYSRHLAGCSDCLERHAFARQLMRVYSRQATPRLSTGLSEPIVERVLADGRLAIARRRRVATVAAMAAGILLALLCSYFPFQRLDDGPAKVAVVLSADTAVPSVNQTVGEAGQALASLLNRTTEETIGQGKLLVPDMSEAPILADTRTIEAAWTPTARSLEEAGRGVSSGLEPVTTSARRAFNLFMREIPSVDKEAKPGL